ncbi:MAG TPA: hypothetical protein VIC06_15200 [Solirubrobacteraceae bacterium]|jgi:hypothetical protein
MPATILILAVSLLQLTICVETVFIGLLLLLVMWLFVLVERRVYQRNQAREERDEAKEILTVLRRMSEIRLETVARLRFPQ